MKPVFLRIQDPLQCVDKYRDGKAWIVRMMNLVSGATLPDMESADEPEIHIGAKAFGEVKLVLSGG